MAIRDGDSFGKMIQTFPARTALLSIGPVVFGLAQVANAVLNGGSLPVAVALLAAMVCYSVLVTQYHLAAFRVRELTAPPGRFE